MEDAIGFLVDGSFLDLLVFLCSLCVLLCSLFLLCSFLPSSVACCTLRGFLVGAFCWETLSFLCWTTGVDLQNPGISQVRLVRRIRLSLSFMLVLFEGLLKFSVLDNWR